MSLSWLCYDECLIIMLSCDVLQFSLNFEFKRILCLSFSSFGLA
jgi:hypothetical protein